MRMRTFYYHRATHGATELPVKQTELKAQINSYFERKGIKRNRWSGDELRRTAAAHRKAEEALFDGD